jgi:hypothetical protein
MTLEWLAAAVIQVASHDQPLSDDVVILCDDHADYQEHACAYGYYRFAENRTLRHT